MGQVAQHRRCSFGLLAVIFGVAPASVSADPAPSGARAGGNAGIAFESKECRTPKTDLERLTRAKVILRFVCDVPLTTSPPAGTGYDRCEAFSTINARIQLKRQ